MVSNRADLVSVGNRSKLPETNSYMLAIGFLPAWRIVRVDSRWIRKRRNCPTLGKKPEWADLVLSAGYRSKLPQNATYLLASGFLASCEIVSEDFGWIPKGYTIAQFWRACHVWTPQKRNEMRDWGDKLFVLQDMGNILSRWWNLYRYWGPSVVWDSHRLITTQWNLFPPSESTCVASYNMWDCDKVDHHHAINR